VTRVLVIAAASLALLALIVVVGLYRYTDTSLH
jgi:hypothetical protein